MSSTLTWLAVNHDAVILLAELLASLLAVVMALTVILLWAFGVGRFRRPLNAPHTAALRYLITEALTKIINDFRHLLALILVLIFGGALGYSLFEAGPNLANIKEALQSVSASLGGLIGSIIGYYFGESKGRAEAMARSTATPPQVVVQQSDGETAISEEIQPARARPAEAE